MEKLLECTGCGKRIPTGSKICPYCREEVDEGRIPFSPPPSAGVPTPGRTGSGASGLNTGAAASDGSESDPRKGAGEKPPIQVRAWPEDGRPIPVGSVVAFGRWTQEGPEPEPILWRVLEIRDKAALLLSERALTAQPYHKEQGLVSWGECSLRRWLNGAFLKNAFSEEERASVIRAAMPDLDYHSAGENAAPIYDAVFLLCADEVKKYLPRKSARAAMPTAHALTGGAFTDPSAGAIRWWLRSPRRFERTALFVDVDGKVDLAGTNMSRSTVCIRPALYRRFD